MFCNMEFTEDVFTKTKGHFDIQQMSWVEKLKIYTYCSCKIQYKLSFVLYLLLYNIKKTNMEKINHLRKKIVNKK